MGRMKKEVKKMVRRRRMGKVRCSQTEQGKFLWGWSLWKEGDGCGGCGGCGGRVMPRLNK